MEIEQETAVRIDVVNRRAHYGMSGMIVQKGHLSRETTGQAQVAGVEPRDVVVPAAHDPRQACVQRGYDPAVVVLLEQVRRKRQVEREPEWRVTAVIHYEDFEQRTIPL
jgi:hypothetical protein